MAKQNPTTVDVLQLVEIGLYEIAVCDQQLDAFKGTHAERMRKANEAVDKVFGNWIPEFLPMGPASANMARTILVQHVEGIDHVHEGLVKFWLTSNKASNADAYETIKERRKKLAQDTEKLIGAAELTGLLDAEKVPTIPKRSNGGRPVGSGGAKSSKVQWWAEVDGDVWNAPDSNNTLGGVAWYRGKKLLSLEGRPSAADLAVAIRTAGAEAYEGTTFSVNLPGGSMGMTVLEA